MAKSAICENIFDGGSIPGLSFLHHDQSDTLTQAVTFHLLQRCRGVNEKAIHAPATIPLPGVYIYIQLCIVYLKQIYIYIFLYLPIISYNFVDKRNFLDMSGQGYFTWVSILPRKLEASPLVIRKRTTGHTGIHHSQKGCFINMSTKVL